MKNLFCNNKTLEERLEVNKRLSIFIAVCLLLCAAFVVFDVVTGGEVNSSNVCSICCMVCVLSLNMRTKKDLEAQIAAKNE